MTIILTIPDNNTLDFDSLPESSRKALAQKAINHLSGNVIQSKLLASIESDLRKTGKITKETTKAEQKALVLAEKTARGDDANRAKMSEFWAAILASLIDGTFTDNTRGPQMSAMEKALLAIARTIVVNAYASKKVALPDADRLDAKISEYLGKNRDKVLAEYEEQQAKAKALAEALGDITLD